VFNTVLSLPTRSFAQSFRSASDSGVGYASFASDYDVFHNNDESFSRPVFELREETALY
jgi:hypothetical protein